MLHIEQKDLRSQGSIMMPCQVGLHMYQKVQISIDIKITHMLVFGKKKIAFSINKSLIYTMLLIDLHTVAYSHAVLWSCMTCTPNFLIPFDGYLYMCRSGIWLITVLTAHSKLSLKKKRDRFLCLQSVELKYCPCMIEPT
ncbi:hypothetical protein Hanom_Chr01g00061531 [Helianthus anomalus]